MNNPFSSVDNFREQFNLGLHQLLDKQQLGTFILCLANATNDANLFEQLKTALRTQFDMLFDQYHQALKTGVQINAVEEDLLVFLKLYALGFENIQLTSQRTESNWLCQYNQLRSFRPKRMGNFQHNGEMFTPFVENQFHFNKPFMAKECFWSGQFNNKSLDIFYNKYPFADLHSLIVPERESCLPQFLNQKMHDYIWQLTQDIAINIPVVGLGYNSYGAYASVNHLHFQMFVSEQGLPVSHMQWKHNGGDLDYPLKLVVCDDINQSWKAINDLHSKKQPYNLLYMPEKVYIIPRQLQATVEAPEWSSGFTWYEMSGAMLLFNQKNHLSLTSEEIAGLLKQNSI